LRSFYNEDPPITDAGGDCLAFRLPPGAVSLFYNTLSLPAASITMVLVDGTNPGLNASQNEALLDLEWSQAVAPGAPNRFNLGNDATASPNGPNPPCDFARALSDDACGMISVSFTLCGSSPAFFLEVASPIDGQAAAHGQSIFVSSGTGARAN